MSSLTRGIVYYRVFHNPSGLKQSVPPKVQIVLGFINLKGDSVDLSITLELK